MENGTFAPAHFRPQRDTKSRATFSGFCGGKGCPSIGTYSTHTDNFRFENQMALLNISITVQPYHPISRYYTQATTPIYISKHMRVSIGFWYLVHIDATILYYSISKLQLG